MQLDGNVIEEEKSGLPGGFDTKRFLDLGTAPLQRIINELKSISSDTSEDTYDRKAARASGLKAYCDFLHGDSLPPKGRASKSKQRRVLVNMWLDVYTYPDRGILKV